MKIPSYLRNIIFLGFSMFILTGCTTNDNPGFYSYDDFNLTIFPDRQGWDLFIYTTKTPDTDYEIDQIYGFGSKTACLDEGRRRAPKTGSFECGLHCHRELYNFKDGRNEEFSICETICDEGGCG